MADDSSGTPNTQGLSAQLNKLQAQFDTYSQAVQSDMLNNAQQADVFYQKAFEATGKQKQALKDIAAIYDKLAKQEAQYLENQKEAFNTEKKIIDLMEKKNKGAKDFTKEQQHELDQLKEKSKLLDQNSKKMDEEYAATKKQVQEMAKSKGALGQAFDSAKTKIIGAIVSVEALRRAFLEIVQVSKDVADISILSGSYAGMQPGQGFASSLGSIVDYTKNVGLAQMELARFGYTAAESAGAFKQFAQISQDPKDMKTYTEAAGALSRMLGVDLSESTGFIIEQNLKFNRTALQSAQTLQSVQENVEKLNQGWDRSIIKGRDITKVLFDISRESNVLAQDQDAIAKVLTSNIVKLQAGGANYQEAFASARKFTEAITKDAPEFLKIMSGRDIYNQIKSGNGDIMAELQKSSPEIAKRVQDIMQDAASGKVSQYAAQRMINDLTAQTKVGLESSTRQFAQTMDIFSKGAEERVMATFHTTFTQAHQMIEQAKSELGMQDIGKKIQEAMSRPEGLKALSMEMKTKYHMDIDTKDLEEVGKITDKNAEVQRQMQEDKLREIAEQKDADAAHMQASNEIDRLTALKNAAEKNNQKELATKYQKEIDTKKAERDAALDKITDKEAEKYQRLDTIGSWWNVARTTVFDTSLGKILLGITGLGVILLRSSFGGGIGGGLMDLVKGGGPGAIGKEIGKAVGGGIRGAGSLAAGRLGALGELGIGGAAKMGGLGGVLEGGLTAFQSYQKYQEMKSQGANAAQLHAQVVRGTAETAGTGGGAAIGTAAGAALGTLLLPGIGTYVGGALGGYLGSKGGKMIADAFTTAPTDISEITQPTAAAQGPGLGTAPGGAAGQPQIGTSRAELVPGAGGANIKLMWETILPIAQAHAYNANLMSQMSAKSPTGG